MWKKPDFFITALCLTLVASSTLAPHAWAQETATTASSAAQAQAEDTAPTPYSEQIEEWVRAGINYFYGREQLLNRNYTKARQNLEKAAEYDHPEALYYLGNIYYEGLGVDADEERSEALYRRAAELGHPDAQMLVGVMHILQAYLHKPASAEESAEYQQAVELLAPAAEAGVAEAQFWYGDMLVKGTGVEKDETAGIALLKKAAEKGNANGQTMLGMYYWLGTGVEQDPIEAYKWVLLGKRGGNSNAGMLLYRVLRLTDEQIETALKRANDWQTAFDAKTNTTPEHPTIAEKLIKDRSR